MNRTRDALMCCLSFLIMPAALAQTNASGSASTDMAAKVQQLDEAISEAQRQIEESQRQLEALKEQMRLLQQQLASTPTAAAPVQPAQVEDLREKQTMQESQLATLQQSKVESDSKYPVRLSGMVLFNGFVNAEDVDAVTAPVLSLPGGGSTALTVRQSILGLDARGPHLFGAHSYADLRMDFAGASAQSTTTSGIYTGFYGAGMSWLRLRTAHAGLVWPRAEAYFALDHPLIAPDTPTSLAAVAEPALAWSGNLWAWNPQLGAKMTVPGAKGGGVTLEGALIDVADAPLTPAFYAATNSMGPSSGEFSRWPGAEARVAWQSAAEGRGSRFGVGGYFAPHRYPGGRMVDAWAATLDTHLHLPARLQFTASFYRGLGLGGLGGGAYKDYAFRSYGTYSELEGLSDVGGWAELKETLTARLQFNAAFGTDQLFAHQLRPYARVPSTMYQSLARNQTFTVNTIFSPSAYLLFSLEYRHIASSPVIGTASDSNVVALSAGYKF